MVYWYDPLNTAYKSRTGAVSRGEEISFRIVGTQGGEDFSAEICHLCIKRDGEETAEFPMRRTEDGFSLTLRFHRIGLYFYHFRLGEYYLSCGKMRKGELTKLPWSWQITITDGDYQTPDWFKGGIMYQIFPDRFCKSGDYPIAEGKILIAEGKILREDWGGTPVFRPDENGKILNNDFFGGNLNGICSKLDYLKELGVTALYLNPIFEAFSNHRYDTGDYTKIDSLLGTEEDFRRLASEAKARGIRIVLDAVLNHTGSDSRYFNKYGHYGEVGAYQSLQSEYADWYTFRSFPDDYESWWGIDTLPALNEASESYQKFIFGEGGVLDIWLERGVSGYRLDVADELPDFFVQKLRASVKANHPDALILGEVWEDASNKIAYGIRREYLQGFELDSVMNYPLKNAIIHYVRTKDTDELRETIAMLRDNYPKQTLDCLMNILGTHDTPRILTVFGGKACENKEEMAVTRLSEKQRAQAREMLKMAAVLQYTLPGVPSVYYGDENGMEGYRDPFCRGCFDWERRDGELNAFYKRLGEIRTKVFPQVWKDGEFCEIYADRSCFVFARRSASDEVYVYTNNSSEKYDVVFEGEFCEELTERTFRNRITIGAYSFGILAKVK